MRWTIRRKITAGLILLVSIDALSLFIVYYGLHTLDETMKEVMEVREPSSVAAYEMEINANGMGFAVLKYVDERDALYRHVADDEAGDFERFHAEYLRLSTSPREQEFGTAIGKTFQEFNTLGQTLMEERDRLWLLFEAVAEHEEAIDDIIDTQLQPQIDVRRRSGFTKVTAAIDMEAALAEIAVWLGKYRHNPTETHRSRITKHDQEFRRTLAHFTSLPLHAGEQRLATEMTRLYEQMMKWLAKGVESEMRQRERIQRFVNLHQELDRVLDDEIQTLAKMTLGEPWVRANQTTDAVLTTTQILIPTFLFFTVGVAWLLIRMVTRPVETLIASTATIANGDLSHRLVSHGRDEFAELARHFNAMVARLDATTVSKTRLEASEEQLQTTVDALYAEIIERTRVEGERQRLQESLRRNEIMAAMGTLVAGVAHEVRNPLFAISSTLDAFIARFGTQAEYQRYFLVLRREVGRLSALMQALLEYGKPPTPAVTEVGINEVIEQAIQACLPSAQAAQVKLHPSHARDNGHVRIDPQRVQQIFENLLHNAIQHSLPGTTVAIEIAERKDSQTWIECVVTDEGPGFAPDDLPRVFEPFFSRRRGGTGLGLAIVQKIVEEHSGTITAGNRPTGGAAVTVRLPVSKGREID